MTKRAERSVLLCAYACDPSEGSESGAGWALLKACAEISDRVTLITRGGNAPRLEAEASRLPSDVSVIRISTPFDSSRSTYRRYLYWLWRAALVVKRTAENYSVVHHATFASDWLPPAIFGARSKNARRVWGPAGGNTYPPMRLSLRLGLDEVFRQLVRVCTTRIVRFFTRLGLRRQVDCFISINSDSVASAPIGAQVLVQPNCVLPYSKFQPPPGLTRPRRRILFVGRLLKLKGVDLVLKSLRHLDDDWELVFVGDGPEMTSLRAAAKEFGPRVRFMGWCDQTEVQKHMWNATVLAFPSLHDSGGWAAAEAAACGLPVVCLDLGGVRTMADSNAVVVSSRPVNGIERRLAAAIESTEGLDYSQRRDWTLTRMKSCLEQAYGFTSLNESTTPAQGDTGSAQSGVSE